MDAPTYPPAARYEPPSSMRTELTIHNVSTAEMVSAPRAWAIVVKHVPMMARVAEGGGLAVHLSNLTVPDIMAFSNRQRSPEVQMIDQEFRALPEADKPAQ